MHVARPTPPPEPTARCPLCGGPNGCAMAAGATPEQAGACWCMRTTVAPAALARVPAAQRRQACVCARCAQG